VPLRVVIEVSKQLPASPARVERNYRLGGLTPEPAGADQDEWPAALAGAAGTRHDASERCSCCRRASSCCMSGRA
jgi:hypothetical protein